MKRIVAMLCVLGMAATAAADGKKVMVLKAEGRASMKVRAKVDDALIKLARSGADQIAPGEVTFGESAVMVGCDADAATCKDEILATLAVDEVVASTVTPKPGGFEVSVRRIGKGGASRDATTFVPTDGPDRLDALAPLFASTGTKPPPAGPRPTGTRPTDTVKPPPAKPAPSKPAAPPLNPPLPDPNAIGPEPQPQPTPPSPPRVAEAPREMPAEAPPQPEGRPSRKLQVAGMVGGAVFVALSFGFWGRADEIQSEIDVAPSRTKADIVHIQELEKEGDRFANAGNLFFVAGIVVAGVSTYYFIKKGRASRTTAALTPAVFDHGAGLALTIGGLP